MECQLGVGASIVKWIVPDPCMVLSESASKLHTNFEWCEEKIHGFFFKLIDIQSQANYDKKKKILRKVYIFSETVQVVCK